MNEPFSYLSATLNLHREPITVTPEAPLLLRYGVALWDGKVQSSDVEKVYQRWLKLIPGRDSGKVEGKIYY